MTESEITAELRQTQLLVINLAGTLFEIIQEMAATINDRELLMTVAGKLMAFAASEERFS